MDHEATASEVEGSAVPDVRNTLQKRSASIFSLRAAAKVFSLFTGL
jgi:hypothetical protein